MKSSAKNVKLATVDELFSTEESRQDASAEKVQNIALAELYPFPDHPFAVRDDDSMTEISGHQRKRACELAGLTTIPVIVRDMDADSAIIAMVDSNLQRENILPSEKAKAYKMKMEAIKRQGARTDLTSVQVGQKLPSKTSREIIAEKSPDSPTQIQRYVRLNELSPSLQKMVDDKKIAMTPAVEISYLKPEEQSLLLETIDSEQATPSLSQAQRMKKLSQSGELNEDTILSIMTEEKKPPRENITLSGEKLRKYFPRSYTPRQMEDTIFKLLEGWQKKRQRSQER